LFLTTRSRGSLKHTKDHEEGQNMPPAAKLLKSLFRRRQGYRIETHVKNQLDDFSNPSE